MNLTSFEKEKLNENKKKIMALIAEAEEILCRDIQSISFISVQSLKGDLPEQRVDIVFDLKSI